MGPDQIPPRRVGDPVDPRRVDPVLPGVRSQDERLGHQRPDILVLRERPRVHVVRGQVGINRHEHGRDAHTPSGGEGFFSFFSFVLLEILN